MAEADYRWLKSRQQGAAGKPPAEAPASGGASGPPRPPTRPAPPASSTSRPSGATPPRLDPETERAQALIRAAFNEQFARAQGAPGARSDESSSAPTPGQGRGTRDPEVEELLIYLDEVIHDYQRHVENIGNLGYSAPMLLYYRDEIQETLALLDVEPGVDTQPYWRRTVEQDQILKARKQDVVNEIGHANFKQYQIINDPPSSHWWWFLNRETSAPPPPAPFWQLWKQS